MFDAEIQEGNRKHNINMQQFVVIQEYIFNINIVENNKTLLWAMNNDRFSALR